MNSDSTDSSLSEAPIDYEYGPKRVAHIRLVAENKTRETRNELKGYFKRLQNMDGPTLPSATAAVARLESQMLAMGLWYYRLDEESEQFHQFSQVLSIISDCLSLFCQVTKEDCREVPEGLSIEQFKRSAMMQLKTLVNALKVIDYNKVYVPEDLAFPGVPPLEVWGYVHACQTKGSWDGDYTPSKTLYPTGSISEVKVVTSKNFAKTMKPETTGCSIQNSVKVKINAIRNSLKVLWHAMRECDLENAKGLELLQSTMRSRDFEQIYEKFKQVREEFDEAIDLTILPLHRRATDQCSIIERAQPSLLHARELLSSLKYLQDSGEWIEDDVSMKGSDLSVIYTSVMTAISNLLMLLKSLPVEPQVVFKSSIITKIGTSTECDSTDSGRLLSVQQQIEVHHHSIETSVKPVINHIIAN